MASPAAPAREFTYTEADFRYVVEQARRVAGITLSDHKQDMVYSRLARRVRALGLNSIREYCALLEADNTQEVAHFINAITTNLTSFYREAHHFEHLQHYLAALPRQPRIRLWSAGCSAGMEPYTMALTVLEALADATQRDVRILATDIDTNMLERGRLGLYSANDMEKVPREQLARHFLRRTQHGEPAYEAGTALKQLVAFKPLNLMDAWPMRGPFDAIFCRNVMIYFDKPTQCALLERFADMLCPGGFLYLGHSESVRGLEHRFQLHRSTIYQKVA